MAVLSMFNPLWVMAQANANMDQTNLVYRVKVGDTFDNIWSRFVLPDSDRQQVMQLNQITNVVRLSVGSELLLPRHILRFTPAVANVMSLTCSQPIVAGPLSKILTVGTGVTEGDVVRVPADCHVTLAIEDGSIIRLPSSATLKFTALRKNVLEDEPEIRLDLVRGRVEISVQKNRSNSTPFEVTTPKSVMGVRGTEFRVGYSPEDGSAQVEVLTGTVSTQGVQDAQEQNVKKGYGLPIDSTGRAQDLEQLLPSPKFAFTQRIMPPTPGRWLNLAPMDEAKTFIASRANTANLGGTLYIQSLKVPRVPVGYLEENAVFFEFMAIAKNGLYGQPIRYGFCQPTHPSDRCNVFFDVPLADNTPMTIDLDQMQQAQSTTSVIKGQIIKARRGRFSIQNLIPGHYQWSLRHQLRDTNIIQSGQFELIAIGHEQP